MPYPWQKKQWRQVATAIERQRLAHAILLTGAEGTGIDQFAIELAQYLLCEAPVQPDSGCGQCRSCILFRAGNHPDIRMVNPEKPGMQIKVDAIRELIEYFHLSVQYGKHKITIIAPAEGMNRHSADGLLKTLEEPPPLSLLILVSYQPAKLPVTIRSRCQKIMFNRINRQAGFDWLNGRLGDSGRTAALLEFAGRAPLKALELSETDVLQQRQAVMKDLRVLRTSKSNPVDTAKKWQEFNMAEVLLWLIFIFSNMAKIHYSAGNESIDKEPGHLSAGLDLPQVISCYDLALKNYHLLTGTTNLNRQSLLEEIIIHWQCLKGSSPPASLNKYD